LVKQCIISLYKLRISRCSIIYTKSSDNVAIEELNDLCKEFNQLVHSKECEILLAQNRITILKDTNTI